MFPPDPGLRRLLSTRLTPAGYAVNTAECGVPGWGLRAAFRPELIITDLRMDGMDGMALFEAVHRQHPTLPVIILTAHGSIPEAVEATRNGVFSFLTKPFESQKLLEQVAAAMEISGGTTEKENPITAGWADTIVTRSASMKDVLSKARMVADSDASVFIRGDSGTGKELLAKAIHDASRRKDMPFVAVNCGAIPEPLLESELFGHRKGSFTGATHDHNGLFQAADGGTLFLDEIGDMPLPLQVKLLRVLQEQQVRPVGATSTIAGNVRIISATHRDLEEEMSEGRFREDLYYRLNVVSLELPALADRREDIPLLANHFLKTLSEKYRKTVRGFAPDAMERMVGAPWPGNVRQLYNVVEQVVTLTTTPVINDTLVQSALRDEPGTILPFADARKRFEKDYLARLLQTTGGNVSQAARLAKRNRTEFYKLLHRHAIDPALFKSIGRSQ
ncbi:MAG: sigma 54-interacting transcriptional regulator [Ectothiorhodospiraceae bacterium]|nr:sigma 54-interacting transcriptional regulator [Ectothiorhodospiraceae bacterium]